jgi:hypothetical protein
MDNANSTLDKWISRIWSIMFALCIGVSLFVIAYASAA